MEVHVLLEVHMVIDEGRSSSKWWLEAHYGTVSTAMDKAKKQLPDRFGNVKTW